MKHPFAVGLGVGAAGLFLWWKRGWLMGLVQRGSMRGLGGGAGPDPKSLAGVAIRHIRRYTFAALQDQSPIVGLSHSSYALNSLDLLEEAVGREAIQANGFDPGKVREMIAQLQDKHATALRHADPYVTQVLGLQAGFALDGAAPMGA